MPARKRPFKELTMSESAHHDRGPKTPVRKSDATFQTAFQQLCNVARVTIERPELILPDEDRTLAGQCRRLFGSIFFHELSKLESLHADVVESLRHTIGGNARLKGLHRTLVSEHKRLQMLSPAKKLLIEPMKPPTPASLTQTRLKFGVAKPREDSIAKEPRDSSPMTLTRNTSFRSEASCMNTSFAWSNVPDSTASSATIETDSDDDEPFYETIQRRDAPTFDDGPSGQIVGELPLTRASHKATSADSQELFEFSLDADDIIALDAISSAPQTRTDLEETCKSPARPILPDLVGTIRQGRVIGDNFALLDISADSLFCRESFRAQWEVQRALQMQQSVSLDSAESIYARWKKPHTLDTLYEAISMTGCPIARGFDSSVPSDQSKLTLSARLEWSNSLSLPPFKIVLQCPTIKDSCDLQRRYGFDNVLYIEMPRLSKPPSQHNGRRLEDQFKRTFSTPLEFLGRRWLLFNCQENKKKKKNTGYDASVNPSNSYRLILIALDTSSPKDVFNAVLNYDLNAAKPAQKIYARTDLFTSRTTAIMGLEAGDIEYNVTDMLATDELDDTQFVDPRFKDSIIEHFDPTVVVNDGCGSMSPWFASEIQRQMNEIPGRCAYQARIAGAKGVWAIDGDPAQVRVGSKPPGPHLKIYSSQVKVLRRSLSDSSPLDLSFNLLRANAHAKCSVLYPGFLQILLNRGVPRAAIIDLVRRQERLVTQEVVDAIENGPVDVRRWLAKKSNVAEERNRALNRSGGMVGGFPVQSHERIIRMLESGFDPRKNTFLAKELVKCVQQILKLELSQFKIHLGRSTTLLGIPDPYGCLAPGEVFVRFNPQHKDDMTGETCQMLLGETLVARNPALAPWDIQKARCVYKPELAHFSDVIVFPTRGMTPFASKLQGGDYDGDVFWVCWEPSITNTFMNYPMPAVKPTEEDLCITKVTTTLRECVQDPNDNAQWCEWTCGMAMNRLRGSLLGTVTHMHEKTTYKTGSLDSKEALILVYLHDYLVDADKQGYSFTNGDLRAVMQKYEIDPAMPDPRYWQASKLGFHEIDTYALDRTSPVGNILDEIYFEIVEPMHEKCIEEIRKLLSEAARIDDQLGLFFDETFGDHRGEAALETQQLFLDEKENLKARLSALMDEDWPNYTRKQKALRKWTWRGYLESIICIRAKYNDIQPKHPTHSVIREWLRRQGTGLSTWDRLKASALAKFHHNRSSDGGLLFIIAGYELCEIKAHSLRASGDTASHTLVDEQYRILRPGKGERRKRPGNDDPDDQDFIAENIEEFEDDFDE